MPESVVATAGAAVNAPVFNNPTLSLDSAQAPEAPSGDLGKDEFLQLLVAQLKYQDPMNPSSSDEFIATSAQFTVVEKLDELTKQGESTALINSLTTASSLQGRQITAIGKAGSFGAVVERSEITSGEVILVTDQGAVRLDQVVSVGAMAGQTAAPAAAPPGTTPTSPAPADPSPATPSTEVPPAPILPPTPLVQTRNSVGDQQ